MAMDNDTLSHGFAFRLTEIPRCLPSEILLDVESFSGTDLSNLEFDRPDRHLENIPALDVIPDLEEDVFDSPPIEETTVPDVSPNYGAKKEESATDVWALDIDLLKTAAPPQLRTWRGFERHDATSGSTSYFSESGAQAFNIAIGHLQSTRTNSDTLPSDLMLRSLSSLVVGRSSVFFQWKPSEQKFTSILPDTMMSGFSASCQRSLVQQTIDCGSEFRTLLEYSLKTSARESCSAVVAFKGCITSVLDSVEQFTAERGSPASVLQLQRLVDRPHQLLGLVTRLVRSLNGSKTDEAVISRLSKEVSEIVSVDHPFGEILQEILSRVSGPWLHGLLVDLGLKVHPTDHSIRVREYLVFDAKDRSDSATPEQSTSVEVVDGLLNDDDRSIIQDIKASLKVLRQNKYLHPSANSVPYKTIQTISIGASDLGAPIVTHSQYVPDCTAEPPLDNEHLEDPSAYEELAWATDDIQQNYFATLTDRMAHFPNPPCEERLNVVVLAALDVDASHRTSGNASLQHYVPCDPLERIRPLIRSHADNVNKAVLHHIFRDCELLDHLDLLQQFYLFGNRSFVERLSSALFSSSTQSTRRERGPTRAGRPMSLQLSTREEQHWPPASSDVQLSLMGILAETYDHRNNTRDEAPNAKNLSDGLSFSIRELQESEIERVVDPRSIHALDFLKLHYSPPEPLDQILTTAGLHDYDDISRFLLKLLRLAHVTTELRNVCCIRKTSAQRNEPRPSATVIRFATQAHHCISAMMMHFLEVGVGAPFRKLLASLDETEKGMLTENGRNRNAAAVVGLEGLRRLHQSCIDRIRTRLFLRRRYSKIRDGIERIFSTILEGALIVEKRNWVDLNLAESNLRKQLADVITLLTSASSRLTQSTAVDEEIEEDVNAFGMLPLTLNWNSFYTVRGET